MSSVDGDQAFSGHTRSLPADKSQNETGEPEQNGVSSGNDLEDSLSLENSECEQMSADNGQETATDKSFTRDRSLGHETGDIHTSTTDNVDRLVSELPSENLHRVFQARMGEKKENQATTSGPDQPKPSQQQHDPNSTMHADRLHNQRNLQLKFADAIKQVGAASNPFVEVSHTRGPSGPTGGGISHALQDYQMQLMLLEQSNKMRLMMARQEQDGIGETTPDDRPEENTVPAACAPQEMPDTAVETPSCGGDDGSASRSFKSHL